MLPRDHTVKAGIMSKRVLTDRLLRSLKPAPKGRRYDVPDAKVMGRLVRVTDKGVRSFMLSARVPGKRWSTRCVRRSRTS